MFLSDIVPHHGQVAKQNRKGDMFMKKIKENLGSIIMCLFELAVGILLLVDPVLFTTGIWRWARDCRHS